MHASKRVDLVAPALCVGHWRVEQIAVRVHVASERARIREDGRELVEGGVFEDVTEVTDAAGLAVNPSEKGQGKISRS